MKKVTLQLITLLVLLASGSIAQNLIAMQNGGNPVFYTNLDAAILNANNGDTLYLPGGFIPTAGVIKISKAINIIGVGYNFDSTTVTGSTIIKKNIEILSTVNGGSITGIYGNSITLTIHDTVSNFKINRCYFSQIYIGSGLGTIPASNISIIETIVGQYIFGTSNPPITNPVNVFIANCYVGYIHQYSGGPIRTNSTLSWIGLTVKNSILCGGSWTYGDRMIQYIVYSLFENCVFVDEGNLPTGSTNNTFRNCLFTGSSTGYIAGPPSNFVYSCIFDQNMDSIFINRQGRDFSIYSNYHLKPSSPGKNAGKDGQDIGLYGGSFSWKEGGLPFTPHYQYSNISGTTDSIGNLNVNIKVAAQDH